jgi:hypothetical protein
MLHYYCSINNKNDNSFHFKKIWVETMEFLRQRQVFIKYILYNILAGIIPLF